MHTMELGERILNPRTAIIQIHSDEPWYQRYKRTLLVVLAVSIVAFIFTIIFISIKCRTCGQRSSTEYLIDSTPWNGVCSQTFSECPSSSQSNPSLLIVSVDGFRAEYLNRGISPTLSKIAACGVRADFMYPVYPTRTFPNHYSLVTGLYPSSHGVIDNAMFDYELQKYFKVGRTDLNDPTWWQKEPIWVTARKQGKTSAAFFWPGSDVSINGSYPNIYRNYDKHVPYEARVNQVLEWLASPTRPDFITMYLEQPDAAAHEFGTQSQQVNDAIVNADKVINKLLAGLQVRNLTNCVNLLIVSDHGMSDLSCDRMIDTRRHVDSSSVSSYLGTFGRVKSIVNSMSVDDVVSKFQCQNTHLRAYRKEDLPVRMHYADNTRIEPVILDIDAGYYLVNQDVQPGEWRCTGANHGYDNIFPDMRTIFFAHGPSFKKNITIRPFLNIELYELMCEIIGINPQPNNGTRGSLHEILRNPSELLPQRSIPSPPVAEVPSNKQELQDRIKGSNCSCLPAPEQEIAGSVVENTTKVHLPFGIPQTPEDNDSLVLLYNSDYILGYDKEYNFPRWTGFTITETKNSSEMVVCWSGDARVENATCSLAPEGLIQRPLYPPEFSDQPNQRQAFYVTNSIPKSVNHTNLLDGQMNRIIEKKASEVGPLNVMMGPVFNSISYGGRENLNSARSRDSFLIPTHIFVILTWCKSNVTALKECEPELLDVHSFLLPNFPYPDNCETAKAVIKKNVARVVDIEKVTGITFYAELSTYHAVRLRTSVSHFSLLL